MAVMGIFLAGVYAVACGGEKQAEKLRDLEFAVIGPDETPQELAQIIEEKKNDSFRLTYTSGNDLYIAASPRLNAPPPRASRRPAATALRFRSCT